MLFVAVLKSETLYHRDKSVPEETGIFVGMFELLRKQNKKTPISKQSRLALTVSTQTHTHTRAQPCTRAHDRELERGDSRMHICFL